MDGTLVVVGSTHAMHIQSVGLQHLREVLTSVGWVSHFYDTCWIWFS